MAYGDLKTTSNDLKWPQMISSDSNYFLSSLNRFDPEFGKFGSKSRISYLSDLREDIV